MQQQQAGSDFTVDEALQYASVAANPVAFFGLLLKKWVRGDFEDVELPELRWIPFAMGGVPAAPDFVTNFRRCGPLVPFRYNGMVERRPLDLWALKHGKVAVCGDRNLGGNSDEAALWFVTQSVYWPIWRGLDLTNVTTRPAVEGVLGRLDEAALLAELQIKQAELIAEQPTQFRLVDGVVELLGSSEGSSVPTYGYYDQSGVQRVQQIGLYDQEREIAALRACEAQPTGGVGTWQTMNCWEALMNAAGFPVVRSNAAPPNYFTTGLISPTLAPTPAPVVPLTPLPPASIPSYDFCLDGFRGINGDCIRAGSAAPGGSMPFEFENFPGGSILGGGGPVGETTSSGGGILGGVGDFLGGIFGGAVDVLGDVFGAVAPALPVLYAATQQQQSASAQPVATGGGGMATPTTDAAITQILSNPVLRTRLIQALGLGGAAIAGGAATAIGLNGNGGGALGPIFRQSTQSFYTPSRVQVADPLGRIHVFAHLGLATRGSRERSVLKRLARDNNVTCGRRGGSCRRRRRPC